MQSHWMLDNMSLKTHFGF